MPVYETGPRRGLVPGPRPRLRARFLRWAHCRRPLRVVGAVAFRARPLVVHPPSSMTKPFMQARQNQRL